MVGSVSSPVTDYLTTQANRATLMASFQKTPQYTQAVSYYQANIASATSVDKFLGNYKLLQFALSAYGLDSAISEKGFLRKLLTEDPTKKGSLAQSAGDPRLLAFAKAFASLNTDGGKSVSNPTNVNAVAARYANVQFAQWVSTLNSDPTLATALTAQSTLQDAVDITSVGALFAQFQKAPATQQAVSYYQTHIAGAAKPADLVSDRKLLDVALTSFGIDPATISAAQATQLLTQPPGASTSLAAQNPAYKAFANAFATLSFDGGAIAHSPSAVTSVVSNYQTASFAKTVAANDKTANAKLFGAAGAAQVATIFADFQAKSGVSQSIAYFTQNAGRAANVAAFVKDPKLLGAALVAFGLDPSVVTAAAATKLLTQDPTSPTSLAQQNPGELAFATALEPAFAAASGRLSSAKIASVAAAFQQQEFAAALSGDVSQARSQASLNVAVKAAASAPITDYQIISDSTLAGVVYGAYSQPASLGALDPDAQVRALTRAGFDPAQLAKPGAINALIQRYLVNAGNQANSGATDPILSMFQSSSPGGSSDPIALDTSALFGGSGSGAGGSVSLLA